MARDCKSRAAQAPSGRMQITQGFQPLDHNNPWTKKPVPKNFGAGFFVGLVVCITRSC